MVTGIKPGSADSRRNGPMAMVVPEEVGHHPQMDDPPRSSASRKRHGRQGADKDDVVRGTPKGRKFEKRRLARPQLNNGVRN